jgi:hypothetical protein
VETNVAEYSTPWCTPVRSSRLPENSKRAERELARGWRLDAQEAKAASAVA